jgi:hypothetical protein
MDTTGIPPNKLGLAGRFFRCRFVVRNVIRDTRFKFSPSFSPRSLAVGYERNLIVADVPALVNQRAEK